MIPKKYRLMTGAAAASVLLGVGYAVIDHSAGDTPTPSPGATVVSPAPVTTAPVPTPTWPGQASPSATPTDLPPDSIKQIPLGQALSLLHDAPTMPSDGYEREKFDVWNDADGDGCDTRHEVLIEEAVHAPKVTQPGCKLAGGAWYSPYDGLSLRDTDQIQIDHMVPLHEAWISGARDWSHDRLVAYGNYLTDPSHLIAVSGVSNQDKSDKDPAHWLPPKKDYVCRYIANWVGIKIRWGLTVDDEEISTLQQYGDPKFGKCRLETVAVPGDGLVKGHR
jgi:hypothetical protein